MDLDRRALALALVVSTLIASVAFSVVKLSRPTTIDVRGSAKRRIASDLSEWSASVHVTRKDRVEAYTALKKDVEVLTGFLEQAGFPRDQVRISAASIDELSHEEVVETGDRVTRKTVFDGWRASQTANVVSKDVQRVERVSREITQLLEKGLDISKQTSKSIEQIPNLDHYQVIVALAPESKKAFPKAPTKVVCLDWSVEDPSKATGSPAEIKAAYESTYQFLHSHIQDLVEAVLGDKID